MKLQTLTVIFIIIMLPITMTVSQYIKAEINTVNLQSEYDLKLSNATSDAIKAYQINQNNSNASNVTTEKIRDVQASINTFYNSLSTGMGVSGYTEEDLQAYIPCLIYTLYDGYYIYTISGNDNNAYTLKPYVYYTENLKNGSNTSISISYTLDNYITVTGVINGNTVTKSGFLIYADNKPNETEELTENIIFNGNMLIDQKYVYKNYNGQSIKHYYIDHVWYSLGTDGKLKRVTDKNQLSDLGYNESDESAKKYIEENSEFTNWVRNNLCDLKSETTNTKASFLKINEDNDPDVYTSEFNEHRREIIKQSIQSNMAATIQRVNGQNKLSATFDFKMPDLDEREWDLIVNNISLISVMEGLPLRNKPYMGYSIVTNTKSTC